MLRSSPLSSFEQRHQAQSHAARISICIPRSNTNLQQLPQLVTVVLLSAPLVLIRKNYFLNGAAASLKRFAQNFAFMSTVMQNAFISRQLLKYSYHAHKALKGFIASQVRLSAQSHVASSPAYLYDGDVLLVDKALKQSRHSKRIMFRLSDSSPRSHNETTCATRTPRTRTLRELQKKLLFPCYPGFRVRGGVAVRVPSWSHYSSYQSVTCF